MSSGNSDDSQFSRDEPIVAQLADQPPTRRNLGPIFGGVLIAFMVAIVLLPLLYMGFSEELVKWRVARVIEQRLDGDLDGAIERLDKLVEQNPDAAILYRQRAEWLQDREDYEAALADYDRALELEPGNASAQFARSSVYQRLERHEDAIEELKTLAASGRTDELTMLNALAYARAVGNTELDQALKDANRAIDLVEQLPNSPQLLQFKAAVLDTRGFIHYLKEDFEKAQPDLEVAVELTQRRLDEIRELMDRSRLGIVDIREQKQTLESVEESMAVMLYHRGLVYQELGDTDQAKADFEQVRKLGHEPNEELY